MPLYTLNRNFLLRTTSGCVAFEKGVPTWITPEMQKEAQAIGAERVDGDNIDVIGDEKPAYIAPSGIEREDEMFAAFELLIERNESGDFTGQGVPTVKAMEKIVPFAIDRAEITAAWGDFKQRKAEAQ